MKIKFFSIPLLLLTWLFLSCSTHDVISPFQADDTESKIFYNPEQQPYYLNGGTQGLLNDLYSTILKTAPSTQECVSARAVVKFSITEQGVIDPNSIKVFKNLSVPEDYLMAAIEAIKSLGEFEPGKMNGKPLKVTYNLPILYPVPMKFIKTGE